jgi:uncharacterized protein YkwD
LLVVAAGAAALRQGTPPASAAGDCITDPALDSEEQLFLQLINNYRAQNGLQPLALSYTLTRAAQWKSSDLGANNYFAHDDLTRTWDQRIRDCGYGYNAWLGENIAAGNSGAQATFDQWRNSPGHNANMLGANYTAIGIARAYSATATYRWYWTTDFGSVSDGWPGGAATATPTRTPVPATATRTNTPAPPTATRTNTPVPPTATRTNTPVPPTTTSTPAPATVLHVTDIDISTFGTPTWRNAATIAVQDGRGLPAAGVTVNGLWTYGSLTSCVTNVYGWCRIYSPTYAETVHATIFGVMGLVRAGSTYNPSLNYDVDHGTNGRYIRIVH